MRRLAVFLLVFAVSLSCEPDGAVKTDTDSAAVAGKDTITVFLTGNEMGALKPCGCSGGQLGGLDKRGAVFDTVPKAQRLVVDTGLLVENTGEQDMIKFNILYEAYGLLGYDAVNLTEHDLDIAGDLALLERSDSGFKLFSAYGGLVERLPVRFAKTLKAGDMTVTVKIAAFDSMTKGAEEIGPLFGGDFSGIDILLIDRCDLGVIEEIGRTWPKIDCIVCKSDADEPAVIAKAGQGPLAVTLGHFARHITRLDIKNSPQGPQILYSVVPVTEDLRPDPQQESLYKTYQVLVSQAQLLDKYPKLPAPDGLKFVGSKACKMCHKYAHEKWSTKAHASALASLEEVGSHEDPECVICHVVGMKYESGYVSEAKTPGLKDVGCENCHGPGSAHASDPDNMTTLKADSVCKTCHTPEKSTHFAGNEAEYLKKIVHWPEP